MVKHIHHIIRLVAVVMSVQCVFALTSHAQSNYVSYCEEELASAEPGSFEKLSILLELSDALRRTSLERANANAIVARNLADHLGDADFQNVAKLDLGFIQHEIGGPQQTENNLDELYSVKLSETAPVELKLRVALTKLDFKLLDSGQTANSLATELRKIYRLANQCDNKRLMLRARAYDLFARVSRFNAQLPESERKRIVTESEALKLADGPVIVLIIDGMAAKSVDEQIRCFDQAADLAKTFDNKRLQFVALRNLSIAHSDARQYSESCDCLRQARRVAKSLGSEVLDYKATVMLSLFEKKRGNLEASADLFAQGLVNNQFKNNRAMHRDRILKLAKRANNLVDCYDLDEHFDRLKLPQYVVDEFNRNQNEIDALGKSLAESQFEYEAQRKFQNERFAGFTSSLIHEVNSQRNYMKLGFVFAISIASLLGILFVHSRFSSDKDTEVNRGKINDLSARMERMESLNRMAGGFAHDFNNILVSVLGNAEVIQMKKSHDNDQFTLDRVNGIIESVEQAAELSHKMLAYAGRTITSREPVEINQLLRDYQQVLEQSGTQTQKIVMDLSTQPIYASVDPTQIEQAVLNLVSNSFVASDPNGTVFLRTGFSEIKNAEDPSLYGTRTSGGEFFYIEVFDNGKGIETRNLDLVFDPFYTDSKSRKGLGLSVVYGVCNNHNGFVQCESSIGHHTSFRILIPCTSQESLVRNTVVKQPCIESHSVQSSQVAHVVDVDKVLIIDDEASVKRLCKEILTSATDFNVITAASGEAGLELIHQYDEELKCVLLDVMMPGMSGDDVLSAMQAAQLNVPVILVTGYSHISPDELMAYPNVVGLIEKPFRAQRIIEAVSKVQRTTA